MAKERSLNTGYSGRRIAAAEPEREAVLTIIATSANGSIIIVQ